MHKSDSDSVFISVSKVARLQQTENTCATTMPLPQIAVYIPLLSRHQFIPFGVRGTCVCVCVCVCACEQLAQGCWLNDRTTLVNIKEFSNKITLKSERLPPHEVWWSAGSQYGCCSVNPLVLKVTLNLLLTSTRLTNQIIYSNRTLSG